MTLAIAVANDKSKQLTLLAKSQVGGLTAAKPQPRLVYRLVAAGTVRVSLRVRSASLKRGHYRIVVVATAVDGQSSRLAIPLTARSRA